MSLNSQNCHRTIPHVFGCAENVLIVIWNDCSFVRIKEFLRCHGLVYCTPSKQEHHIVVFHLCFIYRCDVLMEKHFQDTTRLWIGETYSYIELPRAYSADERAIYSNEHLRMMFMPGGNSRLLCIMRTRWFSSGTALNIEMKLLITFKRYTTA